MIVLSKKGAQEESSGGRITYMFEHLVLTLSTLKKRIITPSH